jgi:predicted aminopeptidase
MKEIKRQGKFQLSNNRLFKELAEMKLKEPKEGWSYFEVDAWFDETLNDVAKLAPEESLGEWIMKQAHIVRTMSLKRMERIKEDVPTVQGTENEKEQDVVAPGP